MRIEQLIYITEIEKSGSIAITSKRLHLSPQNISQAIKNLEEELGVKIFDRSRTGLEPTFEGQILIKKAEGILNNIEDFKQEAKKHSAKADESLTISAFYSLCRTIVPQTIAVFKEKFPLVKLEINEALVPYQVQSDVLNGEAHIGLTVLTPSLVEINPILTLSHILDSPLYVYFRKNSELTTKNSISTKDLIKYPIVANVRDSEIDKYKEKLQKYGKPNFLFVSTSSDIKKLMVLQGLAIGFESALSISSDIHVQEGDLIAAPVTDIEEPLSFYSIHLKNKRLSLLAKEFLKELQRQAELFKAKR